MARTVVWFPDMLRRLRYFLLSYWLRAAGSEFSILARKIRRNARFHNPNIKPVYLHGYIADHRANVACICSVNINQLNVKMLPKRPFTTEEAS